ncbi:unnamed protein product [Caretta caretta]
MVAIIIKLQFPNPVQITVLTSQPGKDMVKQLETGLREIDLVSLRKLQIIEISQGDLLESEDVEWRIHAEEEVSSDACVKCDIQERLLSPALLPGAADVTVRTDDVNTPYQMAACPATTLYKLRVIKALKAEGVCESVLFGLPFIIKPTSCWQLDWDELEMNQHNFHALCHSLLSALNSLEVEPRYNPLHVKSNLYKYLVSGFSRPQYRQQAQPKAHRPGERHHSKQHQSKAKATVAPLLLAPQPSKAFISSAARKDACELSLFSNEDDEFLGGM